MKYDWTNERIKEMCGHFWNVCLPEQKGLITGRITHFVLEILPSQRLVRFFEKVNEEE